MRFNKAADALHFWWNVLQAGGVPMSWSDIEEEQVEALERVQVSRKAWTPNNLLCTYIDIGKALERLSQYDRNVVKSYLLEVIGYPDNPASTTYHLWRHRGRWPHILNRIWSRLPGEYKYYGGTEGTSTHPERHSSLSGRKRRDNQAATPHWQAERIQSRYPVASMAA